jgi:hypothetical protein
MINLIDMRVNPFKNYPEFNLIWPDRDGAPERDVVDYLEGRLPYDHKFLICVGPKVVGMTGYWPLDKGRVALAWTGVVPSSQGQGVWREAFKILLERLSPSVKYVVEPMPAERMSSLGPAYERMGFVNTGTVMDHPELYAKVKWIEYVYTVNKEIA